MYLFIYFLGGVALTMTTLNLKCAVNAARVSACININVIFTLILSWCLIFLWYFPQAPLSPWYPSNYHCLIKYYWGKTVGCGGNYALFCIIKIVCFIIIKKNMGLEQTGKKCLCFPCTDILDV